MAVKQSFDDQWWSDMQKITVWGKELVFVEDYENMYPGQRSR